MAFARFMAGPAGRILRIAAGVALILIGLTAVADQPLRIILAVIGVVFILVGVFNVCLIAPLIGAPFFGHETLKR